MGGFAVSGPEPYATVVNHGAVAGTARPAGAGIVIWTGTVFPTNIGASDLWIDTTVVTDTPVTLVPNQFNAGAGATAAHLTSINTTPSTEYRWQSWLFGAGADRACQTQFWVPPTWVTVNVDLWWTQTTALSGDVRWRLASGEVADGASLVGASIPINDLTVAAPAQLVNKVTRLATGMALTAAKLHEVSVRRIATHAEDTLDDVSGDVNMLFLVISKAS